MSIKEKMKDIEDTICDFADKAVSKVDNKIDVTKLKKSIKDKQNEKSVLYAELGKYVIENESVNDLGEIISLYKDKISALDKKIYKLNEKRLQKEGKCICAACSNEISSASIYCPHCGVKISKS